MFKLVFMSQNIKSKFIHTLGRACLPSQSCGALQFSARCLNLKCSKASVLTICTVVSGTATHFSIPANHGVSFVSLSTWA